MKAFKNLICCIISMAVILDLVHIIGNLAIIDAPKFYAMICLGCAIFVWCSAGCKIADWITDWSDKTK